MKRVVLPFACLIAGSLLFAACSSSSSSAPTTTTSSCVQIEQAVANLKNLPNFSSTSTSQQITAFQKKLSDSVAAVSANATSASSQDLSTFTTTWNSITADLGNAAQQINAVANNPSASQALETGAAIASLAGKLLAFNSSQFQQANVAVLSAATKHCSG
jgi:Zn-dependent oligopeptidase